MQKLESLYDNQPLLKDKHSRILFCDLFFFFSSHSNTLEVITRHYIKLYCNSFWAAQYFTVWLNHNIFNQSLFEKDIQGLFSMLLL